MSQPYLSTLNRLANGDLQCPVCHAEFSGDADKNPCVERSELSKTSELQSGPPSCKDCRVGRGYRPFLDYVELCPLHADAPSIYAALIEIATFTDVDASNHLYKTGSYSLFDEPGSVEIARNALLPIRNPATNTAKPEQP